MSAISPTPGRGLSGPGRAPAPAVQPKPAPEPQQQRLLKEMDIELNKKAVGGQFMKADETWVTNGVWTIKIMRLAITSFLTCENCLKELTGKQGQMLAMHKGGAKNVLSLAKKLKKFVLTSTVEILEDGGDHSVFQGEGGAFCIPRHLVDLFELRELWAPDAHGPAFDAQDADAVTFFIEVMEVG
jgi:hypothetical protein